MKISTIHTIIPHRKNPVYEFQRLVSEIENLFDGLDIEEELQEMAEKNDRNRDSFVRSAFTFLHTLNERLLQVNRVCKKKKEYALMIFPDSVQFAEITELPVSQAMEIMTEIVCRRNAVCCL